VVEAVDPNLWESHWGKLAHVGDDACEVLHCGQHIVCEEWYALQCCLERVFVDKRPDTRTWEQMPEALERLAGWYEPGEEGMFTRDIGSLFGGLANRFEVADTWDAVSDEHNPVRVWVYLGRSGLPSSLTGVIDRDANVHHWAWSLTMGAAYGPGGTAIITARDLWQFAGDCTRGTGNWFNTWSDIHVGHRGAALGAAFRVLGLNNIAGDWRFFMLGRWF
jgi:hypothetical protein